jgi:hypothetical protein
MPDASNDHVGMYAYTVHLSSVVKPAFWKIAEPGRCRTYAAFRASKPGRGASRLNFRSFLRLFGDLNIDI